MAIARKPQSHQSEVESFIARGSSGPAGKDDKRLAAVIRFPPELLKRVDAAAKTRGVSRAAWILMVASRALNSGGRPECALSRAQGKALRAIAAALAAQGHRISHEGVAGVLRAASN